MKSALFGKLHLLSVEEAGQHIGNDRIQAIRAKGPEPVFIKINFEYENPAVAGAGRPWDAEAISELSTAFNAGKVLLLGELAVREGVVLSGQAAEQGNRFRSHVIVLVENKQLQDSVQQGELDIGKLDLEVQVDQDSSRVIFAQAIGVMIGSSESDSLGYDRFLARNLGLEQSQSEKVAASPEEDPFLAANQATAEGELVKD